jgi:hypothetical protein
MDFSFSKYFPPDTNFEEKNNKHVLAFRSCVQLSLNLTGAPHGRDCRPPKNQQPVYPLDWPAHTLVKAKLDLPFSSVSRPASRVGQDETGWRVALWQSDRRVSAICSMKQITDALQMGSNHCTLTASCCPSHRIIRAAAQPFTVVTTSNRVVQVVLALGPLCNWTLTHCVALLLALCNVHTRRRNASSTTSSLW